MLIELSTACVQPVASQTGVADMRGISSLCGLGMTFAHKPLGDLRTAMPLPVHYLARAHRKMHNGKAFGGECNVEFRAAVDAV